MVVSSSVVTPRRDPIVTSVNVGFPRTEIIGLFGFVVSTSKTPSPATVEIVLMMLGAEIPCGVIRTLSPTLIKSKEAAEPFNELLK